MGCLSSAECSENEAESSQRTGEASEKEVSEPSLLLPTWMGYSRHRFTHGSLFYVLTWVPRFCCVFFFFFFAGSESDGLKTTKLSHLSSQLEQEKKRTESLKETCKENMVLLQRQTQLYLCVRSIFFHFWWKLARWSVFVCAVRLQVISSLKSFIIYTFSSLHQFVFRS